MFSILSLSRLVSVILKNRQCGREDLSISLPPSLAQPQIQNEIQWLNFSCQFDRRSIGSWLQVFYPWWCGGIAQGWLQLEFKNKNKIEGGCDVALWPGNGLFPCDVFTKDKMIWCKNDTGQDSGREESHHTRYRTSPHLTSASDSRDGNTLNM